MSDPLMMASNAAAEGLVVLDPRRHEALLGALDAAVAQDPALDGARALLLAPLSLLEALAKDAGGALGDDVLAAERLRLLLALAATQVPPLAAIRAVMGDGGNASLFAASVPAVPCDDGVVDMGGLVIVALAAGRVGMPAGLAEPLINNVLGLAIAAGPAEALARSLAAGMSVSQVKALLAGLGGRSDNGQDRRLSASIASFLTDPCERARWACLELLFEYVVSDVIATTWDAAGTGSIVEVEPRDACPGTPVTLRVEPLIGDGPILFLAAGEVPASAERALDSAHFLPLLEEELAEVVFSAQGHPSVSQLPGVVDAAAGTIGVIVPEGAHAGWIGFADPALRERSNRGREALRLAWSERNDTLPALRGGPVPVESIPLLPWPPTPPRSPQARFDGGAPVVLEASLAPGVVDPGGALRLSWRVAGARAVSIEPKQGAVEAEGHLEIRAPEDHSRAAFVLVVQGACGGPVRRELAARVRVRIRRVDVAQPGRVPAVPLRIVGGSNPARSQPPSAVNVRGADLRVSGPVLVEGVEAQVAALLSAADAPGHADLLIGETRIGMRVEAGCATAALPGKLAVDGLTGTVVYRGPDGEIEDRRDFGPIRFAPLRTRSLVVVRPAAVGRELRRVSAGDVVEAVEEARSYRGIDVQASEPAWIDDAELSLDGAAEGRDVPVTLEILERLNALAARCPGFEESIWVAVVPTPPTSREFFRMEPAEGARAVAVSTPGALGDLLDAEPPSAAPRTTRLRIVGTLEGDGSVRLQPLRVEERGAGSGAPFATDLRAVGLDRAGRVRSSAPVRAMTGDRPARAVVLLPVSDDVVALELRREGAPRFHAFCDDEESAVPPVRRVDRLTGAPELTEVEMDGERITFGYDHSGSAHSSATIEVGSERGWSPVLRLRGCQDSAEIPFSRLTVGELDRVRVAATDGWNADTAPDDPGEPIHAVIPVRRVAARHAGGFRFWADFDSSGEVEVAWTFGDRSTAGPLATVPADYRGPVVLTIGGGTAIESVPSSARDTRTIGADGRVDDRSTVPAEDGRHA